MKRTKQLFLFCFMLIMLTVTTLAVADAVTVNRYLLKNKSGELWEDETVSYNFNMPVDKNVVIHFYEDSDDYYENEGTYGNINMTLKDSDGNVKHIANYKTGTWSSSNTSVAYVNSAGTVTGRSSGSSTITFKTKDGARYTFVLTVKNLVTAKVVRVYDDDIYNDCYIEFTNNTKKDITYITLNITQYDNRGYRLSSPYDYYYLNETIKAGKKAEYYFWVNDNTKSANVKITKVWFSDGTTYVP